MKKQGMSLVWKLVIALSIAGLATVAILLYREPAVGPFEGNRLPSFSVMDASGQLVTSEEFRGRPLLINFWATWCEPCKDEMPEIQRFYQAGAGSFDVLAVTDDPLTIAQRFFTEYGLTLPFYIDVDRSMYEDMLIRFMPSTFFVDASGIIRSIFIGPLDEEKLLAHLRPIVSREDYARLRDIIESQSI